MRLTILILLLSSCYFVSAQDLSISEIPPSLLKDASAVIRYENTTKTLDAIDKMVVEYEIAITILSPKGDDAGKVSVPYSDGSEKIKDLKIEVYDADGGLISKVKKKEVQDVSAFDGFSIANDSRLKAYSYTANQYPYTIKYSYREESKNTMMIGGWFPQRRSNLAVQSSKYKVINNAGVLILSKVVNIDKQTMTVDLDNFSFEANDLPAFNIEKMSPSFLEYAPHVRLISSEFEFFGDRGQFTDWRSYGKWVYDRMLTGRGELDAELISEIKSLIPEGATDIEKAKIIYHYVTNSTRYVSVQLGVGGLMPFKCSDVYEWKYGDCKALSFYTANLLKEVGVEAIYTEIYSGRQHARSYDKTFPGPGQGNHIVLCLPAEGDTTWLECTSNGVMFGYTHSGINDRRALLVKPDGGQLAMTNGYSADQNRRNVNATVEMTVDGTADISMESEYHNYQYEIMRGLYNATESDRQKYLKKNVYSHLPALDVKDYKLSVDSAEVMIKEDAHFVSENLIETAGNYRMLPINLTDIGVPKKLRAERIRDIYIKEGWSQVIEVKVRMPEGYSAIIESDKDIRFSNQFGALEVVCIEEDNSEIKITIDYKRKKGTFGKEEVEAYNAFVEVLDQFSQRKLVLKPI